MAMNPQTFPTDLLVPGLVSWYNSQPADLRVIETNDVALFRVRLILQANGSLRMVIGEEPYDNINATYLGEATFIWRGQRGINLQATADSFFEISKFMTPPAPTVGGGNLNIIPFHGFAIIPEGTIEPPEELKLKMTYGSSSIYGYTAKYTVGLDGQGYPLIRTDDNYVDVDYEIGGFTEVSGGELWVAGRTVNNELYVWGQNYAITGVTTANSPRFISTSQYTGDARVKSVAALKRALVVVDGRGDSFIIGDQQYTPDLTPLGNVKEVVGYWNDEQKVPWNGTELEMHHQSVLFFLHTDGTFSVRAVEKYQSDTNRYPGIIYAPSAYVFNATKVLGTFKTGAVLSEDGTVQFWGDHNPHYQPGAQAQMFTNVFDIVCTHDNRWAIQHHDGQMDYYDGEQWIEGAGSGVFQMSGGETYFAMLTTEGGVIYYGLCEHNQDQTPDLYERPDIKQIHAGTKNTGALLDNGEFIWWGQTIPT